MDGLHCRGNESDSFASLQRGKTSERPVMRKVDLFSSAPNACWLRSVPGQWLRQPGPLEKATRRGSPSA
jgi:hypothetical protein